MSQHHTNPEAYHDPDIYAWSVSERRWVRWDDFDKPMDALDTFARAAIARAEGGGGA